MCGKFGSQTSDNLTLN